MELRELLAKVTDLESFHVFVEALIADWQKNHIVWENADIGVFLEASVAWSKDSQRDSNATWKAFADFLYAGKNYE